MPNCISCGNPLPEDAKFCPVCGAPAAAEPVEEEVVEGVPVEESAPVEEERPAAEEPSPSGGWYQSAEAEAEPVPPVVTANVKSKPAIGSIFDFYRKAFSILAKKPIRLWGLSLLYLVIAALISSLGAFVPIITVPIILLLSLGFIGILMRGYHGEEVRSVQLFSAFRKEEIVRNTAGMCWMELWTLIWGFVPVMNIIKAYSYSFTPYILHTDKEISATEALRKSMRMTDGYKGKLFLADVLLVIGFILAMVVLVMLAQIPYIGFLFGIAMVALYLAVILFFPIFLGLVHTAFFEEISAVHEE